ncbi:hypothetical protein, partial [Pseudomonas aeruginosa]|uniref:hypothetical protein n=1 Tax=Pseudomonas aeruginosa TaxID=287 RepID=UPI00396859AD
MDGFAELGKRSTKKTLQIRLLRSTSREKRAQTSAKWARSDRQPRSAPGSDAPCPGDQFASGLASVAGASGVGASAHSLPHRIIDHPDH